MQIWQITQKKKNYKINRIIDLNLRDFDYNIYLLHFYFKNLENKVTKKKKVYSKKKKKNSWYDLIRVEVQESF